MAAKGKIQILEKVLADLKTKKNLSFEDVCDLLFTFQYKDFDELFQITPLELPPGTFMRIPVYHDEYIVALKIWGINNYSVIHDHSNYDVKIKILKGSLTEVCYRENANFIEYDSRITAKTGTILLEKQNNINSIMNNSDAISVSLHVYRTPKFHLENIRIFDTENRRIAHLSEDAKSCAWNLPDSSYKNIIQI